MQQANKGRIESKGFVILLVILVNLLLTAGI
jgi:hypothetical protein